MRHESYVHMYHVLVLTCFAYAFHHILIVIHPEPHQRPQHPVQSSGAECFPSAILIFRNPAGSASYLKPVCGQICEQMCAFKKHIDCLIEGEGGASIAKLINVVKAMPSLCSKRPSRRNHVILSKQALISLSIMVYGRKLRLQPLGVLIV